MDLNQTEALQKFNQVCIELHKGGYNIIANLSKYGTETILRTRLDLQQNQPELKVDRDHIVLDAIRQITKCWSNLAH